MRFLVIGFFLAMTSAFPAPSAAQAETANTRIATMPFAECLSIITEVSQEVGEEPVNLASTSDLITVRINASDGFVTVSCSRSDNKMTLSKSSVPAAAGMTAAAR